jgi:hypothetical protein
MSQDPINPYAPPQADLQDSRPTPDRLEPVLADLSWPLTFHFKFFTLAPKVIVREVIFVRQRLFKLREHVELFPNSTSQTKLGEIRADRWIDWSALYSSTDAAGAGIGSIGRKGWRSIWRASYDVFNPGDKQPQFHLSEENPFAKFIDGIFGQIPLLGILTVWLFHPRYVAVAAGSRKPVMRLTKKPAFLEGRFELGRLAKHPAREEMNLILAFFMLALLERRRG